MTNTEIQLDDEFASTMQQLVAEAEKTISPEMDQDSGAERQLTAMSDRIEGLEQALSSGLEKLAASLPAEDVAAHLRRVDENVTALRNTETVNQRLFDTLHEELKFYRDNFLRESLQKPFIRDLIALFDDLNSLHEQMETAGESSKNKAGGVKQWSANVGNAIHSLIEAMHRMDVKEIEANGTVDRALHRVVSFEPADSAEEDGRIVRRVKRGFLWHDQILRPEEVVAKRFG